MSAFDYVVICSEVALGNGSADAQGSGRYILKARGRKQATVQVELGRGVTNNEAEYQVLIAALEDLLSRIEKGGRDSEHFSILVSTDALIVVNQVAGKWQVKAPGLQPLCNKVRELLGKFGNVVIGKAAREDPAAMFGH